jgi:hypothetical protein
VSNIEIKDSGIYAAAIIEACPVPPIKKTTIFTSTLNSFQAFLAFYLTFNYESTIARLFFKIFFSTKSFGEGFP